MLISFTLSQKYIISILLYSLSTEQCCSFCMWDVINIVKQQKLKRTGRIVTDVTPTASSGPSLLHSKFQWSSISVHYPRLLSLVLHNLRRGYPLLLCTTCTHAGEQIQSFVSLSLMRSYQCSISFWGACFRATGGFCLRIILLRLPSPRVWNCKQKQVYKYKAC